MHSYVSQMHPSRSAKYFLIDIESSISKMLPMDEGPAEASELRTIEQSANMGRARESHVPVNIVHTLRLAARRERQYPMPITLSSALCSCTESAGGSTLTAGSVSKQCGSASAWMVNDKHPVHGIEQSFYT